MTRSTYSELRDGVVHDVEGVAADEVQRDLHEERRAVYHRGLNDEEEHLRVAEVRGNDATALTRDKPENPVRRISDGIAEPERTKSSLQ